MTGGEAVEDVAHEPGAAREGHELALEADQARARAPGTRAARGRCRRRHVGQLGAPAAERFHHRALVRLLDVHGERLVGLVHLAVHELGEHLRTRHGELIALAAHVLDQDRQVQLAAARDAQHVRLVGVLDAQRDVALQLAIQPLAQLAAGDELAFPAGERRGVHLEVHLQRRLVDAIGGRPSGCLAVADREPDVHRPRCR